MALPLIFVPAGLPLWLVAGHAFTPESLFEDTPMMVGHNRKRRIYTAAPRIADVQTFLERDESATWNDWYENTLRAGDEFFTAEIANHAGAGRVFQAAQWVDPPSIVPYVLGRFMMTGQLLLKGPIATARPSTGALSAEYSLALTGSSSATFQINLAQELSLALTSARLLYQELRLELTHPAEFIELEVLDSDGNPEYIQLEDDSGPIQQE